MDIAHSSKVLAAASVVGMVTGLSTVTDAAEFAGGSVVGFVEHVASSPGAKAAGLGCMKSVGEFAASEAVVMFMHGPEAGAGEIATSCTLGGYAGFFNSTHPDSGAPFEQFDRELTLVNMFTELSP